MSGIKTRIKFSLIFGGVFLFVFAGLVGWKTDHTVLLGAILFFSLVHKYGFHLVLALAGFIGFISLYDAMTFLPNYEVNQVHIKDLYDLELQLFGVMDNGVKVSLCEWFESRMTGFQSFIYGLSYLMWVPAPMAFTIYLLIKDKPGLVEYAYTYLLTNVIGIILYYAYPAAPPWYYLEYGPSLDLSVMGSEAYLSEFDKIVGLGLFNGIYAKSTNIFGAIPSLHAAYPLISFMYAWRLGHKKWFIFFVFMAFGTWIGAVYSWHHYVIDVILGIFCGILAVVLMFQISRTKYFEKFKTFYLALLS